MILPLILGLFTAVNAAPPGPVDPSGLVPPSGLQFTKCFQVGGCLGSDYGGKWTVTLFDPAVKVLERCKSLTYDVKESPVDPVVMLFTETCDATKEQEQYNMIGSRFLKGKITRFDLIAAGHPNFKTTVAMVKLWKIGKVVVAATVVQSLYFADGGPTQKVYKALWLKQDIGFKLSPTDLARIRMDHTM
jgi:hypothetical protein